MDRAKAGGGPHGRGLFGTLQWHATAPSPTDIKTIWRSHKIWGPDGADSRASPGVQGTGPATFCVLVPDGSRRFAVKSLFASSDEIIDVAPVKKEVQAYQETEFEGPRPAYTGAEAGRD